MDDHENSASELIEELSQARARIQSLEGCRTSPTRPLQKPGDAELLLRSMLKHIPVDLWARDTEGNCFLQSDLSLENWGPLSTINADRVAPETLAKWKSNNVRVLEGELIHEEAIMITRDGQRRDFFNIIAPIADREAICGLLGVNIDITERKQAGRALAASEARYRALVESSKDVIFQVTPEGRMLFVNTAGARLAGRLPEELIGRALADFCLSAFVAEQNQALKQVVAMRAAVFSENRFELGPTPAVFSTVLAPVFGPGGEVASIMGTAHDVTARKQAEDALRESEARLRTLLEHLPDLVVLVDREARLRFVNCGPLSRPIEQFNGAVALQYVSPEHHPAARSALLDALSTGNVQSVDLLDVEGTWWSCRVVPLVLDARVESAMVICSDITERKRAEAAMHEQQRLLRQSLEVYEQHRQLAAYEIHDGVAQPLTGALMNLEAAERLLEGRRPEGARHSLAVAHRLLQDTIDQARRLMNGLRPPILDELGILSAVDYLVYEWRDRGKTELDYRHEVQFQRLAAPLETTVFRIIQEGLTNAERHSGCRMIRLALVERQDRLFIEIEDDGVGFDPQQVEAGRFGLKGIRERAHLLGGSTRIESAPGQGTRIFVDLPILQAETGEGSPEP